MPEEMHEHKHVRAPPGTAQASLFRGGWLCALVRAPPGGTIEVARTRDRTSVDAHLCSQGFPTCKARLRLAHSEPLDEELSELACNLARVHLVHIGPGGVWW